MVADCSAFVAIGRFYLQSNTARIVPSTLIINEMSRFSGPTKQHDFKFKTSLSGHQFLKLLKFAVLGERRKALRFGS
jgi:hypothetical protein